MTELILRLLVLPDDNSMPGSLLAYVGLERPNLICLIAMHDLRRLRSFVAPKEIIIVGR